MIDEPKIGTEKQSEFFRVKTKEFEGPIELLLNLIEKRKLHICDVSLAEVTDDYISYVNDNENISVGERANFILVASTLLLIKSLALLPALELTDEEQQSIEELERRLNIYKLLRRQSKVVKENFGKNIIFPREEGKIMTAIFAPSKEITQKGMLSAIKSVIKDLPIKEILPKAVVQKVVSLEEMISRLANRIQEGIKLSFNEFAGKGKVKKVDIVVSFLAMLELVKQNVLAVRQENHFQDIEIKAE